MARPIQGTCGFHVTARFRKLLRNSPSASVFTSDENQPLSRIGDQRVVVDRR